MGVKRLLESLQIVGTCQAAESTVSFDQSGKIAAGESQ